MSQERGSSESGERLQWGRREAPVGQERGSTGLQQRCLDQSNSMRKPQRDKIKEKHRRLEEKERGMRGGAERARALTQHTFLLIN